MSGTMRSSKPSDRLQPLHHRKADVGHELAERAAPRQTLVAAARAERLSFHRLQSFECEAPILDVEPHVVAGTAASRAADSAGRRRTRIREPRSRRRRAFLPRNARCRRATLHARALRARARPASSRDHERARCRAASFDCAAGRWSVSPAPYRPRRQSGAARRLQAQRLPLAGDRAGRSATYSIVPASIDLEQRVFLCRNHDEALARVVPRDIRRAAACSVPSSSVPGRNVTSNMSISW